MRILFVGGGNMAQAIVGGLLANKAVSADDIRAVEPFADARAALKNLGVSAVADLQSNDLEVDVIVLAVKPQMMQAAIAPFSGKLKSQLVISIAAGIRCEDLAVWLGGAEYDYRNIVRSMPNTPALIRSGITGLFAMPNVEPQGRRMAETLLGAVGKTMWFEDEAMLDAVTAISGSGPAYVFYFIESLEQAAKELGFHDEAARVFALETFLGGAKLAAGSQDSAALLRERVTSKRGTTERAIETFDRQDLKQRFIEGVKAACVRSRELGDEIHLQATAERGGR